MQQLHSSGKHVVTKSGDLFSHLCNKQHLARASRQYFELFVYTCGEGTLKQTLQAASVEMISSSAHHSGDTLGWPRLVAWW
jgi:hypothetical protein